MRSLSSALRAVASFAWGGNMVMCFLTLIAYGFLWTMVACAIGAVGTAFAVTTDFSLLGICVVCAMSGALVNMVLTMALFRDVLGKKCVAPIRDDEEELEMWV
jgi:hypothetical protein